MTENSRMISITIDSGAGETVCPEELFGDYPLEQTRMVGMKYTSASNHPIENKGQKTLMLDLPDGSAKRMQVQAVDNLTKPLAAVSRIVSRGNRVVFDEVSYIENKTTGEKTWLRQEGGVYVLDAIVRPYNQSSSFTRPGYHP